MQQGGSKRLSVRKALFAGAAVSGLLLAGMPGAMAGGFNLGAGLGIPYGGVAGVRAGYEIDMGDSLALAPSAAVGHAVAGSGWDVGLQGLFGDKKGVFRLGAGVFYGTNSVIQSWWADDRTGRGVTVGVSPRFQFGANRQHVLDVHLLYIVNTKYDKPACPRTGICTYSEEGSKGKIGIGYAYRF